MTHSNDERSEHSALKQWSEWNAVNTEKKQFEPFILADDMNWAKSQGRLGGAGRKSKYFPQETQTFMEENRNKWVCIYEEKGLPMRETRKLVATLRSSSDHFRKSHGDFQFKVVTREVGNVILAAGFFDETNPLSDKYVQ